MNVPLVQSLIVFWKLSFNIRLFVDLALTEEHLALSLFVVDALK
jgi:hypothetical protein